jgi:23S rRNA pseudouridine1911/1915/1917 synthase
VANALVARYPECGEASEDPREGGLCHRLDVETSGVLLAARSRQAWTRVREAFGTRAVEKRYVALVRGPIADEGEIDLPLRHATRSGDRMEGATGEGDPGREAISLFKVLERSVDASLVEVQILTGVQHQIRAHLAAIGAPIVGDVTYGAREEPTLGRFFLHAHTLGLAHPTTGKRIEVVSPLAPELAKFLGELNLRSP